MQTESNMTPALPVSVDTTVVLLKKEYSIYNAGEIAGFRTPVAEFLIRNGIAERMAAPKPAEAPAPVKTEKTVTSSPNKQQVSSVRK